MLCIKCGKEIPDGSNFCIHCRATQTNAVAKKKIIIIIVAIAVLIVGIIIGVLAVTGNSGLSGTWVSDTYPCDYTIKLNADGSCVVYEYGDPYAANYIRNDDGTYTISNLFTRNFFGAWTFKKDGNDLLVSGPYLEDNTKFTKANGKTLLQNTNQNGVGNSSLFLIEKNSDSAANTEYTDNDSDGIFTVHETIITLDDSLFEVEQINSGVKITDYNGLYGVWRMPDSSKYAISFQLDGSCVFFDNYKPFFASYTCNGNGTYVISDLATPNISGSLTIRKDGEDLIVTGLGQDERFTNNCLYGIWENIDKNYTIEMNFDGACIIREHDMSYSVTYTLDVNGNFVTSEFSMNDIDSAWTICKDGVDLIVSGSGLGQNVKFTKSWYIADIAIPETIYSMPVKEINDNAFLKCWFTSVSIPNGVTKIGDGAFEGCSYLTDVYIPESVTIIGDRAFNICRSLEMVAIPENVTEIGSCAFGGCESLTVANIPNGIKKISPAVFSRCTNLKQVTLPDRLTEIGNYAFSECGITDLIIPDTVTKIGEGAFSQSGLTSITIPSGVREIEKYTFRQGDLSPMEVNFTGALSWLCMDAFDKNSTVYYKGKPYSLDSLYFVVNGEPNNQPFGSTG